MAETCADLTKICSTGLEAREQDVNMKMKSVMIGDMLERLMISCLELPTRNL